MYRKSKKFLGSSLALLMAFSSVTACGSSDDKSTTAANTTVAQTDEATTEAQTQAPTEKETEKQTQKETEKETQKETETKVPETTKPVDEGDGVNTEDYISVSSLKEKYKDDFYIGTIYTYTTMNGKGAQLVDEHFNIVTPENLMKPQYMQPSEGVFDYSEADAMMLYAEKHNVAVVGHTLCWHQQSGKFLGKAETRELAIEQLKNHIYGVASRYDGKLVSWDVVNEAINDGVRLPSDGDWTKCLRKSQWYNSIGPDYLELAFQFAHEASPNSKLYYNDYNMNDKNKSEIAAAMIRDFKSRGIPIDGIGMQAHYSTDTSLGSIERAIELFASIPDLEISMTELDVTISGTTKTKAPTKTQLINQGVFYAKLFNIYKKYSDRIARVTFWGTTDNSSWRSENYPCLFDKNFQPKESFYAVLDPDKYLELHAVGYGDNVRKATAKYGTPKVDAVKDAIWETTEAYDVNTMITAWNGATGTVRMLWDEEYLYVYMEVKDSYLSDRNANLYEQDSVEIFVDQNNAKNSYYDEDDGQYRVNFKGVCSFGSQDEKLNEKFIGKGFTVGSGYCVEMAIPWVVAVKEGYVVGFDAQINDANVGGSRESVAKFSDVTDSSWQSAEHFADLTLIK